MKANTLIVAAGLGVALSAPVYGADERRVDFMNCRSGTTEILVKSETFTLLAIEHMGVHVSYFADSFDNNANHCVGTIKISDGIREGNGYCTNVDPDGDITVSAWAQKGDVRTWSFVHGTGKWQGITGGGQFEPLPPAHPVKEGTYQGCVDVTGTYRLPK